MKRRRAFEENKIISALIGLIGACNNNPKTENTDHVVIKALAFTWARSEALLLKCDMAKEEKEYAPKTS